MSEIVVTVDNPGASPVVVDGEVFAGPTVTNGGSVTLQYAASQYSIAGASDVIVSAVATGDVLRYSSGAWRNSPERSLVIDGGNW